MDHRRLFNALGGVAIFFALAFGASAILPHDGKTPPLVEKGIIGAMAGVGVVSLIEFVRWIRSAFPHDDEPEDEAPNASSVEPESRPDPINIHDHVAVSARLEAMAADMDLEPKLRQKAARQLEKLRRLDSQQ